MIIRVMDWSSSLNLEGHWVDDAVFSASCWLSSPSFTWYTRYNLGGLVKIGVVNLKTGILQAEAMTHSTWVTKWDANILWILPSLKESAGLMLMGHYRPTQWQKDPPDPKKVMRSSSYFSETTHISDQRPNKTWSSACRTLKLLWKHE